MNDYIVHLPAFEGPLDLLLHFVHTNDVDIRRLPIAPICKKYLEFLRTCDDIDLSLSSEWLVMASRLIYIKSCTLLPGTMLDEAPGSESYWEDTEDPKQALIRELIDRERLLAIRNALPILKVKEAKNLRSYSRSLLNPDEIDENITYSLGEIGIYDLLDTYRSALIRSQKRQPFDVKIKHVRLSDIIKKILSKFLPRGVTKIFAALLPKGYNLHTGVMTFLGVLELARTGRVLLHQEDPFGELAVERPR